jgi:hypothetical protein
VITVIYLRELRHLFALLLHADFRARGEMASALGTMYLQDMDTPIPIVHSSRGGFVAGYMGVLPLLFICELMLVSAICLVGYQTSKDIVRLATYAFASKTRLPRAFEAVIHMYNAYLGKDRNSFVSIETELDLVEHLMELIDNLTLSMISTFSVHGSIMGLDSRIDSLVLGNHCEITSHFPSLHDLYEVFYTTHLLIVLRELLSQVIQALRYNTGVIAGVPLTSLEHLAMVHLTNQSEIMDTLLSTIIHERVKGFRGSLIGYVISGILLTIVFFLVALRFAGAFCVIFRATIVLGKQLPPHAIAGNTDLLNDLMGRTAVGVRKGMAPEKMGFCARDSQFECRRLVRSGTSESRMRSLRPPPPPWTSSKSIPNGYASLHRPVSSVSAVAPAMRAHHNSLVLHIRWRISGRCPRGAAVFIVRLIASR